MQSCSYAYRPDDQAADAVLLNQLAKQQMQLSALHATVGTG